ncbi:MAG TPA: LacI family DNA-binding transcriptional regulator [Acidimicrobiia bacterium]|jgi:LacI family transcriptional regulator
MSNRRTPLARERVSLRAVAELAEVSVATVSRVMSQSSHPVAEETRKRVLAAAERLGFQPNQLARALVTARSQTVGVIVHDISDPYFGELVKGLEDEIRADGYRLFVASSDRDPERELEYLRAFEAYQVDALVFAASALEDAAYRHDVETLVDRFESRGGITLVLSDHFVGGHKVHFDNRAATAAMVDYLADLGHRHIGFITGPPDLTVSRHRENAFREAMEQRGLSYDTDLVAEGSFSIEGGKRAAMQIVDTGAPTAIFAANDLMAIGATRALLDAGYRIPDDISVAGFDDMPLAEYAPVPLTTVRVPTYDIGREGAVLLRQILAGQDPDDAYLTGEIIERRSVARPR